MSLDRILATEAIHATKLTRELQPSKLSSLMDRVSAVFSRIKDSILSFLSYLAGCLSRNTPKDIREAVKWSLNEAFRIFKPADIPEDVAPRQIKNAEYVIYYDGKKSTLLKSKSTDEKTILDHYTYLVEQNKLPKETLRFLQAAAFAPLANMDPKLVEHHFMSEEDLKHKIESYSLSIVKENDLGDLSVEITRDVKISFYDISAKYNYALNTNTNKISQSFDSNDISVTNDVKRMQIKKEVTAELNKLIRDNAGAFVIDTRKDAAAENFSSAKYEIKVGSGLIEISAEPLPEDKTAVDYTARAKETLRKELQERKIYPRALQFLHTSACGPSGIVQPAIINALTKLNVDISDLKALPTTFSIQDKVVSHFTTCEFTADGTQYKALLTYSYDFGKGDEVSPSNLSVMIESLQRKNE